MPGGAPKGFTPTLGLGFFGFDANLKHRRQPVHFACAIDTRDDAIPGNDKLDRLILDASQSIRMFNTSTMTMFNRGLQNKPVVKLRGHMKVNMHGFDDQHQAGCF
jgi:hypothetical protein